MAVDRRRVAHRAAGVERCRHATPAELERRADERGPPRPEPAESRVGGAIETVEAFDPTRGADQPFGEDHPGRRRGAAVEHETEELRVGAG